MPRYKRCVKFKCMKSKYGHGGPPRCKRAGHVPRCVSWTPTHKGALGRRRRRKTRRR